MILEAGDLGPGPCSSVVMFGFALSPRMYILTDPSSHA